MSCARSQKGFLKHRWSRTAAIICKQSEAASSTLGEVCCILRVRDSSPLPVLVENGMNICSINWKERRRGESDRQMYVSK